PAPSVEASPTGEKRFTAVERDVHPGLTAAAAPGVDAVDRSLDHVVGHHDGTVAPCLVALVVDVAVGAVEVAARRDLEHEGERSAPMRRRTALVGMVADSRRQQPDGL